MLCGFLPYNGVKQWSVYICVLPREPPSQPRPSPQVITEHLGPLGLYGSFALAAWLRTAMSVRQPRSLSLPQPLLPSLSPQVRSPYLRLHCSLQIGSSGPFS